MSKKNNKDILCQIINSMWIGLTVVGMGWIGFLLVGKKGENKKWTRAGAVSYTHLDVYKRQEE